MTKNIFKRTNKSNSAKPETTELLFSLPISSKTLLKGHEKG